MNSNSSSNSRGKVFPLYIGCLIFCFIFGILMIHGRVYGWMPKEPRSKTADSLVEYFFDNQTDTVYINAGDQPTLDQIVSNLMSRKDQWQKENPNKKVVSCATVSNHDGMTHGLLIVYENK